MADNDNDERHANRHHPHQNPQGPAPAAAAPPQARDAGEAQQAQATQTQQRPDGEARAEAVAAKRREVAQGMRTSSARPPGTRRRPEPTVTGEVDDDAAPQGTPVSQRVHRGQRTMRGIAERTTLQHDDLVQQTSELVSQFKADPESVDPVQVHLLSVQAMVSYGGDLNQLKNEIGRLRSEVEAWRKQGPEEQDKPKGRELPGGARGVRYARKQNRNGTPMRGRARRP